MEAKTWNVSDAVADLEVDPWRTRNPFSGELADAHQVLFDPSRSRQELIDALTGWLAQHQPCLFGQMEAKRLTLAFCLLNENDLAKSDQEIRIRIQKDRLDWKRIASQGKSHGFLIVLISQRIAFARPNAKLQKLARAVCDLYLGLAEADTIYHDELFLGITEANTPTWWKWQVGVNYFSAQGDGRWWRDHRIPGGMALSMNSVGHMARAQVERKLAANPGMVPRESDPPRAKLVYWALRKAMETIGSPTEGSGRGTCLRERGKCPEDKEPPAFDERRSLFGELANFSENRYLGLYHTDHTIPSSYFDEGLWRREDLQMRDDLYFTYLHDRSDVDYRSMGLGQRVTAEEGKVEAEQHHGSHNDA